MKELLGHVEMNPDILAGKPVVRGTRLSVQYIVGLLAQGASNKEILAEYSYLTEQDIFACLAFAEQILETNLFYCFGQNVQSLTSFRSFHK